MKKGIMFQVYGLVDTSPWQQGGQDDIYATA